MESRDTWLSANVCLNEMVIKLTVLFGCKVRNEEKKQFFKMLLVTNGLRLLTSAAIVHNVHSDPLLVSRKVDLFPDVWSEYEIKKRAPQDGEGEHVSFLYL